MPRGKFRAVYDELRSVFGKVPGVMKALSPWPDVLELYVKRIRLIMLSETLLTRAVKEMIAALVSRINECDYCLTYHKSFMVDAGLTSRNAEAIVADYQTAAIPDADKKLLASILDLGDVAGEIDPLQRATAEQARDAVMVADMAARSIADGGRYVTCDETGKDYPPAPPQ